jgi:hypothetical protein
MARTKTRPGTAPSAAHAATEPAPAHDAAAAPDSPAAAVCAALAANPGSTVAAIAEAAATGKPAARDALLAMETAGTATRVKGGKPGIPDTWTLAAPAPDGTSPEADPGDEQPGQPDEDPDDGSPDDAGEDEAAARDEQDRIAEAGDPAPEEDGDDAEAPTSGAPEADPDDAVPAEAGHEDAVPVEQDDDEAGPDSGGPLDPAVSEGPRDENAPADSDSGDGDAPDPALVADLTARLDQIRGAADAAELVLTADGDLKAVLASLDEIYDQAAEARRALKAAIGGRKTPAARPGALRDKVLAHLDAHPGGAFTPHEIHKVLDHSSGAIANALDVLVKRGEAELASEKPHRYRRAGQPATPAAETDGTGSAQDDSAELAGAA